jgi:hypothetical protein
MKIIKIHKIIEHIQHNVRKYFNTNNIYIDVVVFGMSFF